MFFSSGFFNSPCLFLQSDSNGSKDKKKKKKKSSSLEEKKDDQSVTSQRDEGLNILSQVDEYEHDSSDEEVNTRLHEIPKPHENCF